MKRAKALKHPQPSYPAGVRIPKGRPFPWCVLRTTRGDRLPYLRDAFTPEAREWVRQQWDKAITQGDEDVATPSPGIEIELPKEFDSDGDSDADTDKTARDRR